MDRERSSKRRSTSNTTSDVVANSSSESGDPPELNTAPVVTVGGAFRRVPPSMQIRPYDSMRITASTGKKADQWTALDQNSREQCIAAVARLILFMGCRNEIVNPEKMRKCLNSIDPTYKEYLHSVIPEAINLLRDTFGYNVTSGAMYGDNVRASDEDKFFVSNHLSSPYLHRVIADMDPEPAYTGFRFIIYQAILGSSGREATGGELLAFCRRLDERFPATYQATSSKSGFSLAIPELRAEFHDLMVRMVTEGYLQKLEKEDNRSVDVDYGKVKYVLGIRFCAECDKMQLAYSYFNTIGLEPDHSVMREIENEIRKDHMLKNEKTERTETKRQPASSSNK